MKNPFVSTTFTSIWLKHFHRGKPWTSFDFIPDLSFIKHSLFPLYANVGKTHTKGVSYTLSDEQDYKKKAFLIYDVPSYFKPPSRSMNGLGINRIKQYPGFLIEIDRFIDFEDYITSTFNKSSRYKLKKYLKRFEMCFDIKYHMYHGEITTEEYNFIFDHFKALLEKRFLDKGTTNNNLDSKEWNFYKEVAYPMILEKKASLFVIYNQDKPIGVTLSYFSDTILFDAITVFDIDYAKFNLGSITVMKLIEWCIGHQIKTMDFSKGYFDYKKRWATKTYDFEYHVYYDESSLLAKTIAHMVCSFYKLKQYLRDKKLNEKMHRIIFKLRNKQKQSPTDRVYVFSEPEREYAS